MDRVDPVSRSTCDSWLHLCRFPARTYRSCQPVDVCEAGLLNAEFNQKAQSYDLQMTDKEGSKKGMLNVEVVPESLGAEESEGGAAAPDSADIEYLGTDISSPTVSLQEVYAEKRFSLYGAAYTEEEFIAFFGGTEEWNKAEKANLLDTSFRAAPQVIRCVGLSGKQYDIRTEHGDTVLDIKEKGARHENINQGTQVDLLLLRGDTPLASHEIIQAGELNTVVKQDKLCVC